MQSATNLIDNYIEKKEFKEKFGYNSFRQEKICEELRN